MSVYGKSQMGKFMLIGGVIGCGLSLMSRETRSVWGHRLSTSANNCAQAVRTVYQHPNQVGNYLKVTGTRVKGLAREISSDFQEMVDRVEKAGSSTNDTYQYVMEIGNEIAEMAGKIKRSGQNMANFQEPMLIDTEQDALQRLENETSVPNPGTMPNLNDKKPVQHHEPKHKNGTNKHSTQHA